MAGCQSYQWGAQFPDMVDAILPFCASARTSPHNRVFLEGVKAALTADAAFAGGDYAAPPEAGLRAFGRVYAGWAYSQTFYRERLHRELGFETWEELLRDWERDHLDWDANDLLAKLRTWQQGDISANERYGGDFERALGAIRARAILVPCTTDLYFPPEDNAIEARHMPNADLRPFALALGPLRGLARPRRQRIHALPRRVRNGAIGGLSPTGKKLRKRPRPLSPATLAEADDAESRVRCYHPFKACEFRRFSSNCRHVERRSQRRLARVAWLAAPYQGEEYR